MRSCSNLFSFPTAQQTVSLVYFFLMASCTLEWTLKYAFPVSILCLKWVRWTTLHMRIFPYRVYMGSPDSCWPNCYLLQTATEQQWGTQEIWVVMDALKWIKWFFWGENFSKHFLQIYSGLLLFHYISMYDLRYLFKAKLIFFSPSPPPVSG